MSKLVACSRCPWEMYVHTDASAGQVLAQHYRDRHALEEKGVRQPPRMQVPTSRPRIVIR